MGEQTIQQPSHGACIHCGCGFASSESYVNNLIASLGYITVDLVNKKSNLRLAKSKIDQLPGEWDRLLDGLYTAVAEMMDAMESRLRQCERESTRFNIKADLCAQARSSWDLSKISFFVEFPDLQQHCTAAVWRF